MKKSVLFVLLLMTVLLLTGCVIHPTDVAAPPVQSGPTYPAPIDENVPTAREEATLWFRYGDEPLLAVETRVIETSPTLPYEKALLTALIEGPASAHGQLAGLFPQGTRVVSTQHNGRTLFVTLSRQVLGKLPDEPDLWQSDPRWKAEIPLRRALAMQSISATVTENCPVDRVVILVEQGDTVTDSLLLRQSYYRAGGGDEPAAPLIRDERLLLTPRRTAEVILQCWQERDLLRLMRYVPDAGAPFPEDMAALPHLVRWEVSGGSVQDGQAVFTVSGAWLDGGAEVPFEGLILRLIKTGGVWGIPLSELDARKEAAP